MKDFYDEFTKSKMSIYDYAEFMKYISNENQSEFKNYIKLFNVKDILKLNKDEKFILNNLKTLDKDTYTLEFNKLYKDDDHPIELIMYTFTNAFTKISFLVGISEIEKNLYAPEFRVLKKDDQDEFYLSLLTSGLFKIYVPSDNDLCYLKPINIDVVGDIKMY